METYIQRILAAYGLTGGVVQAPTKGYRNQSYPVQLPNGSLINLMVYKREASMLERIRRANRVADYAHRHGLPARQTYDPRIIRLSSARGESYAALYEYLPGRTIPWEAYTQKHIKLLGKALSDLHAVLADFDERVLPAAVDEYMYIVQKMQKYFADSHVRQALKRKLNLAVGLDSLSSFETLLKACAQLPGQQALHMDFVRSNILFGERSEGLAVTGILDFEKTAHGSPLFDIARSLAFLLVDCKYKEPGKVRKYFLLSGYQKRGAGTFANVPVKMSEGSTDLLEQLLGLFLLYDFYKFLRHSPYEFLSQNEHFMRTRTILLERRLVQIT